MCYRKCALYFSIRCRDHAHISLTKWDLRFPFFVYVWSLWEMFWYIGNALDFRPRGPWFESGRLQQFVFFTFFSFWPFTVPSPLLIKTRRIANNVRKINIFTLLLPYYHLIQYFLRVILMGDDFFSNLDSTFLSFASNIAVILAWFLLIFEYVVAETIYYLFIVLSFFSVWCHHGLLMIIINIIIIIIVITITIKIIIIMIIIMIIIVYMSI